MKHIKKHTYIKPNQAVTLDVILTLIVQILEAVQTLLGTKTPQTEGESSE